MKYAVLYQWYETTKLGVIEAESEYMAKVRFCIKELKQAKADCVTSDLFLDTEEGSLKQQIQDLVTGYGTGTIICLSCDREWLAWK